MTLIPAAYRKWCTPRLLAFLMLLAAVPWHGGAAGNAAGANRQTGIDRYLLRYERILVAPSDVLEVARENGTFSLPTRAGVLDLVLARHDIRSPQYRAEEILEGGFAAEIEPLSVDTFRGTVPGRPEVEARFTITPDRLEGIVITPEEWYFVEPMGNYELGASPSDLVTYSAADVRPGSIGTCGTSLMEKIGKAEEVLGPKMMLSAASLKVAEVATEADYEYVSAMGGAAEANASILEILNQVDGIYTSQLSLSLRVSYQHSWATFNDPYVATGASGMLTEFRSYWNQNLAAQRYEIAHMWTGKDMDGSTVGIAFQGVVCGVRSYSYGISQRFVNAPGKYILTAHEIGHNFGANHTEEASPPQAACSNTIMNSYIGTSANFCSYSRGEITAYASQHSSCLLDAVPTCPCDLNGDGKVDILDVQVMINRILNMQSPAVGCDLNKDGSVNVLDLQFLANVVLGANSCP
jgi:hypothetical protein